MSKRKMGREANKVIRVFAEGDTEENYILGLKNCYPNIKFSIKVINLNGGGYKKFIDQVKTMNNLGCLAAFLILDVDRAKNDLNEYNKLLELYDVCKEKSKILPVFIIGNNDDFEYFACTHCSNYRDGDVSQYIRNTFKRDVNKFKSDSKIYEYLNSGGRSLEYAIARNEKKYSNQKTLFKNEYNLHKSGIDIDIKMKKQYLNLDSIQTKGTNFQEFISVLNDLQ